MGELLVTISAKFLLYLSNLIAPMVLNRRATFFQRSISFPLACVC